MLVCSPLCIQIYICAIFLIVVIFQIQNLLDQMNELYIQVIEAALSRDKEVSINDSAHMIVIGI